MFKTMMCRNERQLKYPNVSQTVANYFLGASSTFFSPTFCYSFLNTYIMFIDILLIEGFSSERFKPTVCLLKKHINLVIVNI